MSDDRLREIYRQVLSGRIPGVRAGCVEPERLMSLIDRTGPEDERLRTLDHVMACPTCREEFEMIRAVAVAGRPAAWRVSPALAAAAMVVLLVGAGLIWRSSVGQKDVFRGTTSEVTLLTPSGDVATGAARRFAWRPTTESVTYLMEVLDPEGSPVYTATTRDTAVVLPDSVSFSPGAEYRWWVRATLADGSVKSATPLPFVVRR